jgi:excinuclease ABC subunit B
MNFKLSSEFAPTGDQPQAIEKLSEGIESGEKYQTLGVTGSGKTFTIANVVEKVQKPTWFLRTIRLWRLNFLWSSKSFFQKMR